MGNLGVWLERNYQVRRLRKEAATERALRAQAQQMSMQMKQSHPWANVTGDAEKSLGALVDKKQQGAQTTFTVAVGYVLPPRVAYGWALELAHAGAFAIVRPTVRQYSSRISRAVAEARRV